MAGMFVPPVPRGAAVGYIAVWTASLTWINGCRDRKIKPVRKMTSVISGAQIRRPEIRPIQFCKSADVGDGVEIARLADAFEDVTDGSVSLAFFDDGYTGAAEVRS